MDCGASKISDWFLWDGAAGEPAAGYFKRDGQVVALPADEAASEQAKDLRDAANAQWEELHSRQNTRHFSLKLGSDVYRVHRSIAQRSIAQSGPLYIVRRNVVEREELEAYWGKVPAGVQKLLLAEELRSGGLVLFTGEPGAGKSTSLANSAIHRMKAFGGVGWSAEDPIEYPIAGEYGGGVFFQKDLLLARESLRDACRDVVRSYPVDGHKLFVVGEVRDEAAADMVRIATSGILVMGTMHAKSPGDAIERLLNLVGAGDEERMKSGAALAAVLRLVIHQRIDGRRVTFEVAVCNSPFQAAIRSGHPERTATELRLQQNRLREGTLWYE